MKETNYRDYLIHVHVYISIDRMNNAGIGEKKQCRKFLNGI